MTSKPSKFIWIACAELVYLARGERVATCIEGPANRLNPSILQSMRRHLLDPTESDLFVYAPYDQSRLEQFEENASITYLEHIYAQLEHLGPAVLIHAERDFTREEITNWFLNSLNEMEHAVPGQKEFWHRFSGAMIWYNPGFVLPPPRKEVDNCVVTILNKVRCYSMIERYEQQGGFLYDRVIFVRESFLFGMICFLSRIYHRYQKCRMSIYGFQRVLILRH